MRKAEGKRVGGGNRCHEVYIFTYIDHKYAVQYCCQDEGFFSAFFLVFLFFFVGVVFLTILIFPRRFLCGTNN